MVELLTDVVRSVIITMRYHDIGHRNADLYLLPTRDDQVFDVFAKQKQKSVGWRVHSVLSLGVTLASMQVECRIKIQSHMSRAIALRMKSRGRKQYFIHRVAKS